MEWELVNDDVDALSGTRTDRLRVEGGYLYRTRLWDKQYVGNTNMQRAEVGVCSMCFVADLPATETDAAVRVDLLKALKITDPDKQSLLGLLRKIETQIATNKRDVRFNHSAEVTLTLAVDDTKAAKAIMDGLKLDVRG